RVGPRACESGWRGDCPGSSYWRNWCHSDCQGVVLAQAQSGHMGARYHVHRWWSGHRGNFPELRLSGWYGHPLIINLTRSGWDIHISLLEQKRLQQCRKEADLSNVTQANTASDNLTTQMSIER